MRRVLFSIVTMFAVMGITHSEVLASGGVSLRPGLEGTAPHTNVVDTPAPMASDVINAYSVYCSDGTTACYNTPQGTNFAMVSAAYYGPDSSRAYPFAPGGNVPDSLIADCDYPYLDANGDSHLRSMQPRISPTVNIQYYHPGTIVGKAVLQPGDTEASRYGESAISLSGYDATQGITVNYVRGSQLTDNVNDAQIGGAGFQISMTGPIRDYNRTTQTSTFSYGTLTCSTKHAVAVYAGAEAVTDPDGDEG